jgi:NADH-quinone oxidoreductase subunit D
VGTLKPEDAVRLGAVGPVARASGVARDARKEDPYAVYAELDFNLITDDHNDVFGRAVVRLKELMESYRLIRQIVKNMPEGPIAAKAPRKVPAGEAISRYEAPRGEDVHYVKANGTEKPERVKVRAPTLANIQAVSKMLENGQLADMPIIVAAIDPCFSCTDRAIEVVRPGGPGSLSWKDLRDWSIRWYLDRGLDCASLNKKLKTRMDR